jgi:hypothetical protein
MNLRALIGTYWEAHRGDGTPFREFATREQALEYVCEFRRLDATGAGRRIVKVTRYAGRGLTQADVEAAVARGRLEELAKLQALLEQNGRLLQDNMRLMVSRDADVDAAVAKAVAAERERCVAWIVAWRRDMPMSPCELEATIAHGKAAP